MDPTIASYATNGRSALPPPPSAAPNPVVANASTRTSLSTLVMIRKITIAARNIAHATGQLEGRCANLVTRTCRRPNPPKLPSVLDTI
jgi:hypothetical protein